MRAVVLAGGKGTRLQPYTTILPKPLMPIGDMPILEVLLRQMKRAGINHVILTVGHLASLLRAYFGNGAQWKLDIAYSLEQKPLGTARVRKRTQGVWHMTGKRYVGHTVPSTTPFRTPPGTVGETTAGQPCGRDERRAGGSRSDTV